MLSQARGIEGPRSESRGAAKPDCKTRRKMTRIPATVAHLWEPSHLEDPWDGTVGFTNICSVSSRVISQPAHDGGGGGGVGRTPGRVAFCSWRHRLASTLVLSLNPLCRQRCPSACHHPEPLLSRSCLSLPPNTPFLSLGRSVGPQSCPCFTALCRVHKEEGNSPCHWPGASRRTPPTAPQWRLLGPGMSTCGPLAGHITTTGDSNRPLNDPGSCHKALTPPHLWGP